MRLEGSQLQDAYLEDRCDVLVLGSGTAGAIAAMEAARAGKKVILLEEGKYFAPEVKRNFKIAESVRSLYRNQGGMVAFPWGDTPPVVITLGCGAGGSSALTGGVCFRIPDKVHRHWAKELGLTELALDKLLPFYHKVEELFSIRETPQELRSKGVFKFEQGAQRLGITCKPVKRNMTDCRGCSRCNFICPHGAKQSVDIVCLPKAEECGAKLYFEFRATRLIAKNGKVQAVAGEILDSQKKRKGKFTIHADTFVLAMGTVHTAHFLLKNRACNNSGLVGKGLTLHPAIRIYGLFDEVLNSHQGALQSVYVDDFMDDGITLIAIHVPPNIISVTLPGIGPGHREFVRLSKQMAAFGAFYHDQPSGRVWRGLGREPFVTYRLSSQAKAGLVKACQVIGQIYFAAGARQILLPIWSKTVISSPDELKSLTPETVKGKWFEISSYHPLGTARMGLDRHHSVVNQFGQTWDYPNLWISDGATLPTSIGVNSQEPIMALALRNTLHMLEVGNNRQ
jgi:choline dehydrogenase-like flavoprotein